MRVTHLRHRAMLLSGSSGAKGSGRLGDSWTDNGSDGWDGSGSGGSSTGGWTDDGGSAWQ